MRDQKLTGRFPTGRRPTPPPKKRSPRTGGTVQGADRGNAPVRSASKGNNPSPQYAQACCSASVFIGDQLAGFVTESAGFVLAWSRRCQFIGVHPDRLSAVAALTQRAAP
jgi:hypothetical protein